MFKQGDVKRMSRRDLLEILVLQSKKIDELTQQLEHANELLASKQIMITEAGSIAEASLKLNKIFEIAQEAANQYLENIKLMEENKKKEKNIKKNEKKKSSSTKKKKVRKSKES